MSKERQRPPKGGEEPPAPEPFATIDDCIALAQQLAGRLEQLGTYKHPLGVRKGEGMTPMIEEDSVQIRAGKRTYFLDVARTNEQKPYLRITESRFTGEEGERERNTIFVFPEEAEQFAQAVAGMAARIRRDHDKTSEADAKS